MTNKSKIIKTSVGNLDIYKKEDWIALHQKYLSGEILSIPDIAEYLNIHYKVVLRVFKRFNLKKLPASETSKRCNFKVKETCKDKYGDENFNDRVKARKTLKERYGDENYINTDKILETRERKYGSRSYVNIDKIKQTCLERYGVENYNNYDKIKQTKKQRYGDENYLNQKKARVTKKQKYGDENYNNRDKAKETCLKIFGTDNPAKNELIKNKMRKSILPKTLDNWKDYLINNNYELLDDYRGTHVSRYLKQDYNTHWIKYRFKHKDCGYIFKASFNSLGIRCPKCFPYNKSLKELKYNELIENIDFRTELGLYDKISPYQIDIFIPELNIGFEYNGSYWHSLIHDRIHKNYHKDKTDLALKKGIKLYHIWEHDNEEIVKSMILSKLNKTENKIYARKCEIKEIKTKDRKEFFDENHLHGDVKSTFSLGLYRDNELISCISFRKHKEGIEIARFASKLNTQVVGGFDKLLKHSISKLRELGYSKIITYCDRDWTPDYKDSVYYKNGFNFVGDSGCTLFYTLSDKVYSRETFQKHKLKELFPESYSDGKTANQILEEHKIYPCYNSGNWKFELLI